MLNLRAWQPGEEKELTKEEQEKQVKKEAGLRDVWGLGFRV